MASSPGSKTNEESAMREFMSLILFMVLTFGIALMSIVIGYTVWFWFTDTRFYRQIQRARRDRLVSKFMEDLKK